MFPARVAIQSLWSGGAAAQKSIRAKSLYGRIEKYGRIENHG
jgi:hypothetical protein